MARPRRVAGLATRELPDGDTVIVNREGAALVLNPMGGVVVYLADGTRTVEDIAREIHDATTGADLEQIDRDVREVLQRLAAASCVIDVE